MKTVEDLVFEHPFFQDVAPEIGRVVAGCARNAVFRPGELLFREGEPANWFYCIRGGRLALELHAPHGAAIRIDTRQAGDVAGWSWIVPPYRWYCDARAVEEVHALQFDGACLRRKMEQDVNLGYALYKRFVPVILRTLQGTRMQLLDVYARPGR
jgi:CRP-like cAMP-binding protein